MPSNQLPFYSEFIQTVSENTNNYFGEENHDDLRFGPFTDRVSGLRILLNKINHRRVSNYWISEAKKFYSKYGPALEAAYKLLPAHDQNLYVKLMVYRVMGSGKIKLPLSTQEYRQLPEKVSKLIASDKTIQPGFMNFILRQYDLSPIGYDINIFLSEKGIIADFFVEQYAYRKNGINIEVKKDDVVLDLGGCWGDTALYFANKSGVNGKVYTFEFIPGNLELFRDNIALNPKYADVIEIVPNPVNDISDVELYYSDNGPGSKVQSNEFSGYDGKATTLSVDDLVVRRGIQKVDFIKMDVEGCELPALKGAINTIKKHKPILAISIYHSMEDMTKIPVWINELGIGYKLYLDHYTIHSEETVLFAKAD